MQFFEGLGGKILIAKLRLIIHNPKGQNHNLGGWFPRDFDILPEIFKGETGLGF